MVSCIHLLFAQCVSASCLPGSRLRHRAALSMRWIKPPSQSSTSKPWSQGPKPEPGLRPSKPRSRHEAGFSFVKVFGSNFWGGFPTASMSDLETARQANSSRSSQLLPESQVAQNNKGQSLPQSSPALGHSYRPLAFQVEPNLPPDLNPEASQLIPATSWACV